MLIFKCLLLCIYIYILLFGYVNKLDCLQCTGYVKALLIMHRLFMYLIYIYIYIERERERERERYIYIYTYTGPNVYVKISLLKLEVLSTEGCIFWICYGSHFLYRIQEDKFCLIFQKAKRTHIDIFLKPMIYKLTHCCAGIFVLDGL